MNAHDGTDASPSRSGRAQRTGDEAPWTSEAFEVDPAVGTDSPLGSPAEDCSTAHITDPDGTPVENPSG